MALIKKLLLQDELTELLSTVEDSYGAVWKYIQENNIFPV